MRDLKSLYKVLGILAAIIIVLGGAGSGAAGAVIYVDASATGSGTGTTHIDLQAGTFTKDLSGTITE